MSTLRTTAFATVLTALGLLVAQPAAAQDSGGPLASTMASFFERASNLLVATAEQVPEENYSYQPTEEVMTFGEMVGHVISHNFRLCAEGGGVEPPAAADREATTKAELVEKLQASVDFCVPIYQEAGANLSESASAMGSDTDRAGALVFNLTHSWQHYGNFITYVRSLGMVPPSSQGD